MTIPKHRALGHRLTSGPVSPKDHPSYARYRGRHVFGAHRADRAVDSVPLVECACQSVYGGSPLLCPLHLPINYARIGGRRSKGTTP